MPSSLNNNPIKSEHDNVNVLSVKPMLAPVFVFEAVPVTSRALRTVKRAREAVKDILDGQDDRVLLVVGPCSLHDVQSALEYAGRLRKLAKEVERDVLVVMRTYFEKPRTTVGWKGMVNDPHMNGSHNINLGMKMARQLLLDINEMGVPCGYECLDTITPQYLTDLISWAAIGARTTEAQIYREMASALSMPVGFKNGTTGNHDIAVNAVIAARHPHSFMSATIQGLVAIVNTNGNPYSHVILRGGKSGPNFEKEHVQKMSDALTRAKIAPKIMIDCSHGNSNKDHRNQPKVNANVCEQIANGNSTIMGLMMESHLNEGKQKLVFGRAQDLKYGVSITDACMSWESTKSVVRQLGEAVRIRRTKSKL